MSNFIKTDKLEKHLRNLEKNQKGIVLILGGSFNPVHKMHIKTFEVVKNYLEKTQNKVQVLGGFLIPSSDDYTHGKLKNEAYSLNHRNQMIELELNNSDWIEIFPHGYSSAKKASMEIQSYLRDKFKLENIETRQICGADFAVKYKIWERYNPYIILSRGKDTELVEKKLTKNSKQTLIKTNELHDISSSLIRNLLKENKNISEDIISKEVFSYLKNNLNK